MTFPKDDKYMKFDKASHRYVLTEADVFENLAINLSERVENENVRKRLLDYISKQVYNFIHTFNKANDWQDFIIAKTESGRAIIKEAMEEQLIYFLTVGDVSRSLNREERAFAIDEMCKQCLLKTIPEIGTTILYTGMVPHLHPVSWEW